MLEPSEIERALVITAHPDDVDFGAAGTVAVLTDAGVHVTYCLVTDGEAGGSDRALPRAEMAEVRRDEQRRAAKEVGVTDLVFLGQPDGRVEANLALREAMSRVIRQVRPTVVISQSPERNFDRIYASHPDHLAAGEAAIAAVYPDSRNPFAFPGLLEDGLEPWSVSEMWLMAGPSNNSPIDVSAQVDRKISALMCHESQHQDPVRTDTMVREWLGATAQQHGLPVGSCAEAFWVVDTR